MNCFTPDVCEKLGYYVYALIDPRNNEIFYIGKGINNRVFAHVSEVLKDSRKDSEDNEETFIAKKARINDIINNGYEVKEKIIMAGLDENTAFAVEASWIENTPNLTNIQSGHHSELCNKSVEEIQADLGREEYIEPDFKYLIFKIYKEVVDMNNGDVYEAGRKTWALSESSLKECKCFIVSVDGIVKGVYTIDSWVEKNKKKELIGHESDDEIKNIFIEKKLPDYYIRTERGTAVQASRIYSKN